MRTAPTLRTAAGAPRRAALLRAGLALCGAMVLTVLALFMDEQAPARTAVPSAPTAAIGAGIVPEPAQPPPAVLVQAQMPVAVAVPSAASAADDAPAADAATTSEPVREAGADDTSHALVEPLAAPLAAAPLAPGVLLPTDALRPAGDGYQLQLGVFGDAGNALVLYERLSAAGFEARIQSRVVLGPFPDRRAAEQAQAALRRSGEPAGILLPPRAKR